MGDAHPDRAVTGLNLTSPRQECQGDDACPCAQSGGGGPDSHAAQGHAGPLPPPAGPPKSTQEEAAGPPRTAQPHSPRPTLRAQCCATGRNATRDQLARRSRHSTALSPIRYLLAWLLSVAFSVRNASSPSRLARRVLLTVDPVCLVCLSQPRHSSALCHSPPSVTAAGPRTTRLGASLLAGGGDALAVTGGEAGGQWPLR